MAKLTAKQRAELQRQLDDDAAAAPDDDDFEIEFEGRRVRGTFARVSEIAAAWGFKLERDPDPEPEPDKGDGKTVRFGRRTA